MKLKAGIATFRYLTNVIYAGREFTVVSLENRRQSILFPLFLTRIKEKCVKTDHFLTEYVFAQQMCFLVRRSDMITD
jgi:hypothetical protein